MIVIEFTKQHSITNEFFFLFSALIYITSDSLHFNVLPAATAFADTNSILPATHVT